MRILLDECLPRKLKHELKGYDVRTVPEMGWSGKKNGELLSLARSTFDVFLTADQNIVYQQKLESSKMGVIILVIPNNRLDSFQKLIPEVRELLSKGSVEGVFHVGGGKV